MTEEPEFNIVIHTLQEKRDALWKMTESNMNTGLFNIMDQIRLEQIEELDKAMNHWEEMLERWKCNHPNATKEEHLTGEGSMEYVEWYDNTCADCGRKWTTND